MLTEPGEITFFDVEDPDHEGTPHGASQAQ